MPAHEQQFLDKQGTRLLWSKIKALTNKNVSCESRTAQEWNQDIYYQSQANVLYIYKNYKQVDGKMVSAIKIGDGTSYLIDLPFIGDDLAKRLQEHITNSIVHITEQERNFWNIKVTAYKDTVDQENLILSKN